MKARVSVESVLQLLRRRITPLHGEILPLAGVAGRVTVESVVSPVNIPHFERSAMDGYAVRSADLRSGVTLHVIGESRPAHPFDGVVESRQAVSIRTGAPIPSGADTVLPVEEAYEAENGIQPHLRRDPIPGKHVIRIGEDVRAGQTVLPAGRLLRPQDVGLLSSLGIQELPVVRQPRVARIVTGNELLPPGSLPQGYRIVDSHSPMLAALITRDGGIPLPRLTIEDDLSAIQAAIAGADADVILVSGGTSVGAEDYAARALTNLGELAVHGVAMKPGGPTGIGFLPDGRIVFLLPGNPVACFWAYDLFVGGVIRRLGGRSWEWPYRIERRRLLADVVSEVGRTDFIRVNASETDGVEPLVGRGASNLSSVTEADGFIVVESEAERWKAGEWVQVWWYDSASTSARIAPDP